MKNFLLIALSICFIFSCKSVQYPNFTQTAQSISGVVSVAQPLATLAGYEMYEKGGNAVDAAVASAFALSVVEPSMSGLGGRFQAIIRLPNGEIHGIDASTEAPMNYDTSGLKNERYGYRVIGIPGVVAGLTKILEEHGSLPLKTVMAPAIRYAKKGFPLLKGEALRHAAAIDQLKEFEGSRQYFLKEGRTYQEGEKLIQKDLAKTLQRIVASGKDGFYKGETAEKIVADFKNHGGILTMEDLANYKAKNSKIVSGNYRGHDLHGLWLPSFGAITVEFLQILENFPMEKLKGADWIEVVNQAMKLAYGDRWKQLGANQDSIMQVLTSKAYAKQLANKIKKGNTNGLGYLKENAPESWTASLGHTTHLSAADGNGLMVAITQSLGPNMGSKVASPDLGFLYAVTLGPYLGIYKPGERARSHISPFLITKDGQPYLVLGAAGGSRIIPAIVQVSSRLIDHNYNLKKSLASPRIHTDSTAILLETHEGEGWSKEVIAALKKRGIEVKLVSKKGRFGRVHAVLFDSKKNQWIGGADPDWEGAAAGVEK